MNDFIDASGYITRRHAVIVTLAALLVTGATAGCGVLRRRWRYRYRLAAEVERNGKIFRGSSVIEVLRAQGYSRVDARARGEAVAVDIDEAGTLFVLLRKGWSDLDWAFMVPHRAFADRLGSLSMTDPTVLSNLANMVGEIAEINRIDYPQMVKFVDIRQPATAQEVDPEHLSEHFGKGVKFVNLSIELTDAPITIGIKKRFTWWYEFLDKHFDGSTARIENAMTDDLTAHLSSCSFTSEM